jgi:hypothetical protein
MTKAPIAGIVRGTLRRDDVFDALLIASHAEKPFAISAARVKKR